MPTRADGAGEALEKARRTGILRVGYNDNVVPFAYRNEAGQLVGFDVENAYALAGSLHVDLELVPFEWSALEQDLKAGRFDVAMSGVYVSFERLERFLFSDPYFHTRPALLVRHGNQVDLDYADLRAREGWRLGVLDAPKLRQEAASLFPLAHVVPLDDYSSLGDVDVALWSEEQARCQAALDPSLAAVKPTGLSGEFFTAWMLRADSPRMREYLNYWLRLQEGTLAWESRRSYWLNGKRRPDSTPRWSVVRNVLHWAN